MRALARVVHRSFRRVEQFADWLTGAAGPVFVTICVILVSIGMWTFFACMFGNLAPLPPAVAKLIATRSPMHIGLGLGSAVAAHPWLSLRWVLALTACLFIVYSIGYHYYMAVREPPGSVIDGLSEALGERRNGPGSESWWSRHRRRATLESLAAARDAGREGKRPCMGLLATTRAPSEEEAKRLEQGKDLWVQVKACQKCPRVPLWKAMACLPPELRAAERTLRAKWNREQQAKQPPTRADSGQSTSSSDSTSAETAQHSGRSSDDSGRGVSPARYEDKSHRSKSQRHGNGRHSTLSFDEQALFDIGARGESIDEIRDWLGEEADVLVPPPKPERTHHCSICDRCSLKFDHHCPWLNQCVGIGNERYFVLFMVWLSIGCGVVVASGFSVVRQSLSFRPWKQAYVPRIFPLLTFALCAIMGFALGVMAIWQLLIIGWGETSVENSDNQHYRALAQQKGKPFTNVYDVGFVQNLLLFFNAGTPASPYSLWTLLAPYRIAPYSDGWHFAKRIGQHGRHLGIAPEEELTDDEEERDEAHPLAS